MQIARGVPCFQNVPAHGGNGCDKPGKINYETNEGFAYLPECSMILFRTETLAN